MNANFFKKAFDGIKNQKAPKTDISALHSKSRVEVQQKSEKDQQKQTKALPLNKRICKASSKEEKAEKTAQWKHDKYEKLLKSADNESQSKKSRTILVEDETCGYQKLIKILGSYKMCIEEINDYKVVFSDRQTLEKCQALLQNEGIATKRADSQELQEQQEKRTSKIFNRLQ